MYSKRREVMTLLPLNRTTVTSVTVFAGSALALALLSAFLIDVAQPAQAQTETLLYSFGGKDGDNPNGNLISDSHGNLYGTTVSGGNTVQFCAPSCGVVFRLTPSGTESVLYRFDNFGTGWHPSGGVVFDSLGNLYGATRYGGVKGVNGCGSSGCGAVFQLTPAGIEKLIYKFTGGADGGSPDGSLARDSQGNLYGTTEFGGVVPCANNVSGCGAVFELTPPAKGTIQWKEKTLHTFTGPPDGETPSGGVVRDSNGNLYGTSIGGGAYGYGAVFELTAAGEEKVLYSFKGSPDAAFPAYLLRDSQGNLYGASSGGAYGYGAVFELTVAGTETLLYSFTGGADGRGPYGRLVLDAQGNLYGTTVQGGIRNSFCPSGCGVVFSLTKTGQETVLHRFTGPSNSDGADPVGGLLLDAQGNLYGATTQGGCCGGGTVFKVTPSGTYIGGADGFISRWSGH